MPKNTLKHGENPWSHVVPIGDFEVKNELPESPGVYFFLAPDLAVLYVGKATILRDRVKSYFAPDLMDTRGPKLVLMREQATNLAWVETDSVLEALLVETNLIKHFHPPFNTISKDDKSYNHIVITKEAFPRVLLARERDLLTGKFAAPLRSDFGPFPTGTAARIALKILRPLFPFRDKCEPCTPSSLETSAGQGVLTEKSNTCVPCFHAQIGLCPGVCTGAVDSATYTESIKQLEDFLSGHKVRILKNLEKQMHEYATKLQFEEANKTKKQLFALQHIHDVALMQADRRTDGVARIEAYDVAHLAGQDSVGVMTVIQGGELQKSEYRKFILKGDHKGNDLSALEEVLVRRLSHSEWEMPDILVVDGSFLQYGVAERILNRAGILVPILGVVKDSSHKGKKIIGQPNLAKRYAKDCYLVNAEAHRFAIEFHKKKRSESFLG